MATSDSLEGQFDFDSAISISTLALRAAETEFGPYDTAVAHILDHLTRQQMSLRRYSDAVPFALRALEIRERILPSNHLDNANSFIPLGYVFRRLGRLAEAGLYFERALAIVDMTAESDLGTAHRILNNLAGLRRNQGRLIEADSLYSCALAIMKKEGGEDAPYLAAYVGNKAGNSWDLGRFKEAEEGYLEALAIKRRTLGEDHWSVASSMNHLGSIYRESDRYSESESFHLQALAIERNVFDPEYPSIAQTQYNLGRLYVDQGRYAAADTALGRAVAIWESAYGPRHCLVAKALESMSQLKRLDGDPLAALNSAKRASNLRLKHVLDNASLIPECDALAASQDMRGSVGLYLASFFDLTSASDTTNMQAVDLVVSSKGAVSDGMFRRERALVEESDASVQALAARLNSTKLQLSRLFVAGPGPNLEEHRKAVDSLEQATVLIEAELFRHSASFRRHEARKDVNTEQLVSLLPDKATLVEYLKYDEPQLKGDSALPRYLAAVLTRDAEPAIVNLGDAFDIDRMIEIYRQHMSRISVDGSVVTEADQTEYREISSGLYDKIWRPIANHLGGKDLALVAPDGALNFLSFPSLMDSDGEYLVEHIAIHNLSSGRDLIRLNERPETGYGLFAMGDPDYNASVLRRQREQPALRDSSGERQYCGTRSVRSSCGAINEILLNPLPGTREEIESAETCWQESTSEPAAVYFDSDATEDRFKAEAPGSRVIHLATHGYFLGADCGHDANGFGGGPVGENPLLRSGLFFAGANHHGMGADSANMDDGTLTAYEVSALDFSGTELAILSACETGLGEVKTGEGVYGLRRAFQIAGVRTLVTAFWSVSDQTTADMMGRLYDRKDVSWPEWMRTIQLDRIESLREQNRPDHPINWAAFGVIGDWR